MPIAADAHPKLRSIDARTIVHHGQPAILLRDPLQLTDKTMIIPQQLGPALALMDGTRDISGVSASLALRFGVRMGVGTLDRLLTALDDALLLENERSALAQERALAEYQQAPFRAPTSAGTSYPADPDELRTLLRGHLNAANDVEQGPADGRGLVSPHIDYARGASVYARVWKRAKQMAQSAQVVVLLGTDHYSEGNLLTLTRQNYATPFGVLPTAKGIVDAIAEAMGTDTAYAGELHHLHEHSVELAAIWLHYIRDEEPCEIVPVLCGAFERFVQGQAQPGTDPTLNAFLDACRQALAGHQVLIVAAGDLAHIGPAFGSPPVGLVERARLQSADDEIIEYVCAGDAEGFLATIQRERDRFNVCGVPPIYLTLRLLSPARGQRVAYLRCPADEAGTSLVSICGIVFR
jgi:AmmeMemoRadiSam system protein B